MKIVFKSLLVISPLLFASDCGEDAPYGAIKGIFSFLIVNEAQENLVNIDNGPYYPDSIHVL